MNNSNTAFAKALIDKHKSIKDQLVKTFNALVANDDKTKIEQAQLLRMRCQELASILSSDDTPGWLKTIMNESFAYINSHKNPATFLKVLMNNKLFLLNHNWKLDDPNEIDFDLDKIYQDIKNSLNVKELFDTLIDYIGQILDSGQIDSIAARESLKQLLSILKQNNGNSFLQLRFVARFVWNFTKNATWVSLKKISELKIIVEATEKTIKELNEKDRIIYDEIKEKVADKFNSGINRISNNKTYQIEDKTDD